MTKVSFYTGMSPKLDGATLTAEPIAFKTILHGRELRLRLTQTICARVYVIPPGLQFIDPVVNTFCLAISRN